MGTDTAVLFVGPTINLIRHRTVRTRKRDVRTEPAGASRPARSEVKVRTADAARIHVVTRCNQCQNSAGSIKDHDTGQIDLRQSNENNDSQLEQISRLKH